MRIPVLLLALAVLASGAGLTAQVTFNNSASGGPASATTIGTLVSVDTTVFQVGSASALRASGAANASYLPTTAALNPTTTGNGGATADPGLTIQWWYKPTASTVFSYLWGDANWVGTNGAFRCFQNGVAGTNNIIIRGPMTQLICSGTPLVTNVNAKGFVHFALVINTKTNNVAWYVNGTLRTTGTASITGTGSNLTCFGYNGSASPAGQGNYDDFRIYDWARTAPDILADYLVTATGTGPSGSPNVPDLGYYECETPLTPHIGLCGVGTEAHDQSVRLVTAGSTIKWAASSPAPGPYQTTAIINLFMGGPGKPRTDAFGMPPATPTPFITAIVPGLEVGHCASTPPLGGAICWPDGLNVGPGIAVPCGGAAIPIPYSYGNGPGPDITYTVPGGVFVDGDRFDIQWVTLDMTYPTQIAATNRTVFEYITPQQTGPSVHAEARGVDVIQVAGFFEFWNTGTVPIQKVSIDLSGCGKTWAPTGLLNSGGTLATGDSYRFNTENFCDLIPTTNPRYTLTGAKLEFTFDVPPTAPQGGFEGPINHFYFDCSTTPTGNGRTFVGAIVEVTFADTPPTVVKGPLVADPNDVQGAQVDL